MGSALFCLKKSISAIRPRTDLKSSIAIAIHLTLLNHGHCSQVNIPFDGAFSVFVFTNLNGAPHGRGAADQRHRDVPLISLKLNTKSENMFALS